MKQREPRPPAGLITNSRIADTPPLNYCCRSILSPVPIHDLEDMQKHGWKDHAGNTLQQKMDLGGMPELPKGFGSGGGMCR